MPRLDGTGPQGQGPLTGRGFGSCGAGLRRGYGYGRGWGRQRFISPKNELSALEQEEKALQEEIKAIQEEKRALKDQEK